MKTINYGIDLGTSNSCIAYASDGKAEVFPSNDGAAFISSAVMYQSGQFEVGQAIYRNYPNKPHRIAVRFKRAMGTNQTFKLEGIDKPLRPEDLSAKVLIELKKMASVRGHEVAHAVICTPAKFDSAQVDATNEAAKLAGIIEPVLMSEPMAAAYGYGVTTEKQGTWLLYDMGAGTFDAVVVQVRDGKMSVLEIDGENRLGGTDMDRLLWDGVVIPEIAKLAGIRPDAKAFAEFTDGGLWVTEATKIQLSFVEKAMINTDDLKNQHGVFAEAGRRIDEIIPITRAALEARIEPLVDKSMEVCRRVLTKHKQVSEILLVGGPTNMPIVRAKLRELGLPVNFSINPMTAVATGAALYASTQPEPNRKGVTVAVGAAASHGKVAVQLDYEPTSEDTEAPVVIRCTDPRAGFAEISSGLGNWVSGRVPLNAGGFVLTVPVIPRKLNSFAVRAFGPTGSVLECERNEFAILGTSLVAEAPPLPASLCLEVEGDSGEEVAVELIQKGTPLDAAKGTRKVKTTVELARGSRSAVNLKLYEGNSTVLRANQVIRHLELTGDSVPRKLPAGTEIEITVKVDTSRRITAEAYIPSIDESIEIPKCGDRVDVTNPHQLDARRRALAAEVEALDAEITNPEVKVKLELCRRQLWNTEVTKALRVAKEGERGSGDAFMRVNEALLGATERLVVLRHDEQEAILPAEWSKTIRRANYWLATDWANNKDHENFASIKEEGDKALQSKRWSLLKDATREMGSLAFAIEMRNPDFWRNLADALPTEPECYTNPAEARELLSRLTRPRSDADLRNDVVKLYRLLPPMTGTGLAETASNLRLIR